MHERAEQRTSHIFQRATPEAQQVYWLSIAASLERAGVQNTRYGIYILDWIVVKSNPHKK